MATPHPARAEELPYEFADRFRRGAAVGFPGAMLVHLLFTYGVWPEFVTPSLIASVVLCAAGFAFRWVQRASIVLAAASAYFWLFLVYVLGVSPMIGYLTLSKHDEYLPWAPLISIGVLLALLVYRVRATLRDEWSQPLDMTAGVQVAHVEGILWREPVERDQRGMVIAAFAMVLVFGPVLYLTHGTLAYLFVLFVLVAQSVAFITTCGVSWWVAYWIAVRRWERASGICLRLPRLGRRRRRNERR